MVLVVIGVKKKITPRTTLLGKITVAATMVLYAAELLRFVANIPYWVFTAMEAVVGSIVVVSIIDKVVMMARDLREPAAPDGSGGRIANS